MIKKTTIYVLVTTVLSFNLMSQQKGVCETPSEDDLLDFNSITKCSIEKNTEDSKTRSKTFTVKVSSRRRVKRKRKEVSSTLNKIESNKINEIKDNSSIVGSLNFDRENVVEKVPFHHVDEAPLFKSCQKVALIEQKKCFNEQINKHIIKNFQYPEEAHRKGIQGRVLVQFVIDKDGDVNNLNIRTPYKGELLEKEARRIIAKLPKFTPGKHNGQLVKVKYGVPISFKIPGVATSNVRKASKNIALKEVYNFTNVDEIPKFKKCASSNETPEDCFNKLFIDHINKNFNYPLKAVENNVEGKIVVYFVIDSNGDVVNIKTRTSDGKEILESATKKLIEKLPKFIPGKHNGKPTNVSHVFPVLFSLS